MSIINSNTTYHSPKKEEKFANKLFIALGVAIVAAFVIFLFVRKSKDMNPQPTTEQVPVQQGQALPPETPATNPQK